MLSFFRPPESTPYCHPWKRSIAMGRAYELLREDALSHLRATQKVMGYQHCRFHGIFHDDMAVVRRGSDGGLHFQWHQVDKVYDALLEMGLKPFVELNPMPSALASGTQTIFEWKMNVTPPRLWAEWEELVGAFVRHLGQRYGMDEIRGWYFEVWNEPNLSGFWSGSKEEYWKLYEHAVRAIKGLDPLLKVGGPASSKGFWIADILEFCASTGTPIDFVSTHCYPQDTFNQEAVTEESLEAGEFFLKTVRGVRETVRASAFPKLEIHWTEWNTLYAETRGEMDWLYNPSVDNFFGAALIPRLCLALDDQADSLCYWTASDIFEEGGMPHAPYSSTYGLNTIHGIPKAHLRAFELLARLRGPRLALESGRDLPDGCGMAGTEDAGILNVLLWAQGLKSLSLDWEWSDVFSLPWSEAAQPVVVATRICRGAGSAYETWRAMGAPQNLTPVQLEMLRTQSKPVMEWMPVEVKDGRVDIPFRLLAGEILSFEVAPADAAAMPKGSDNSALERWNQLMSERSRK
jgi:xylan 1,4-beta-xylosidase